MYKYNKKYIREEAEDAEDVVDTASSDAKQEAIELVKDILDVLENNDSDDDKVEIDAETCQESASIIVESMMEIMGSDADIESKLEATNILNQSLKLIMEEAGVEETDGGLPCEVAENESDDEISYELGEHNPTDVDEDANYGEGELNESAANALLRQMLKK